MALIDNLVSYWKFDESSGNAADAHGSNTLTNNNTATFAAGKINNGADLESSSSQSFSIADGSQSGLDITGDLSLSMWLNPESITGTHGLVSKFVDSGQMAYRLAFNTTQIFLTVSAAGFIETNAVWTNPLSTGSWQHIVVTYDASAGEATLYYNGTADTTETGLATSIKNSTATFRIGARSSVLDAAELFYDGKIDEVGIWSKTLSGAEVTSLYNSGSGLAYPLAGAYSLAMDVGSFVFTGNDVGLELDMPSGVWTSLAKNDSTFTAASKNSSTFTAISKS